MPSEERKGAGLGARIISVVAVLGAVLLAAFLLFDGGGGYQVKMRFTNAGQLVKGNLVEVGGVKAGTVDDFEVTPDGQVEVKVTINEEHAPLRVGTTATIRPQGRCRSRGRPFSPGPVGARRSPR